MSGDPSYYILSIDWSSVGGYPNNNDADYLLWFSIDRGRNASFSGDPISGEAKLARAKVGQLTLTMDNNNGRYDVYNSSSPLYPHVSPSKIVRLSVIDDLGTTYVLFTGSIDDIRPTYGDDHRVTITCSDAWKQMSQNPMSTAMYTNSDVSKPMIEIAGYLQSGSVLAGYAIQTGSENYPYMWGDEETPYQVLHDLAELDGGFCSIDTQGFFRFIARVSAVAQSPSLTLDQSQVLRDIQMSQPWDGIINYIVVGIHDLTLSAVQVLVWTTPDVGRINPGQTLTRRIRYTGANGKLVPLKSLAGADGTIFNMPAQDRADGLGNVVTGLPNLVRTIPPGGAVAMQISLTNNKTYPIYLLFGSAAAGNLCGGKLFGKPLDDLNPSSHVASDATSIQFYGTRTLRLDYRYMQGLNNANAIATHYLARFKDPKAMIMVKVVNRSTVQFAHDLNALVNFSSTYLTGKNNVLTTKTPTATESRNNSNGTGIVNPGFETGDFIGYVPDLLGWSISTTDKYSGNYSAYGAENSGRGRTLYLRTIKYSALQSTTYVFSAWINVTYRSFSSLDINVILVSASGVETTTSLASLTSVSGWTQYTYSFSTNSDTTQIYFKIGAFGGGGGIKAYVDDISVAAVSCTWNYPTNALTQNNSGAYADAWIESSLASQLYTDHLILTGFGYALKSTDTIAGISVRIRKKTNVSPPGTTQYPGGAVDYSVKLVKAGTISGTNHAKAGAWTNQFADYIYGNQSDLWGLSLTYTDINASNFGIAIAAGATLCNSARGWATAHIDSVEMTVYTNNGAFAQAFRIVGIKHQSGITTKEVTTTWTLEPQINSSGLRSPDQVISEPSDGEQFPIVGGVTY
jgi:hypothetical protein